MKKRLLSIFAMASVAFAVQAGVGDDLTAKYLKNADFSADEPVQMGICTYAKDMPGNNTELYGMQPVTGWTEIVPTDNVYRSGEDKNLDTRASGIFELGKQSKADYTGNNEDTDLIWLGGTAFVTPAPTEGITEGKVLGMVAVWGGTVQYTQEVTLPAGAYTIEIPVFNSGGTGSASSSVFGFIAEDGTKYVADNKTWTEQTWETMTIDFLLNEETTGVISLGYTGPAGSGSMPHLYIAGVKILQGDDSAIKKAEVDKLKEDLLPLLEAGDELGVDTSNGWAVYNNDNATLEEVQAAIEAQKELNDKGMTDFTDFFINNAHFALGTPLDAGVCTYDYDMEKNSTKYYGMQPIQDWIASNPSTNTVESVNNGRASGLFAVGSGEEVWLGSVGDVVPATKANGSTEGNVFGFISVWSAKSNYTQVVTLPAGSYTITIPTYNERGTVAVAKNLCGFIADDGTEYLATTTTFPVGKWSNETIKFRLEEETSGVITIGYTAADAGSGSMPHLFIDEFTLMYNGVSDISPSLLALNGAVRNGENYLDMDAACESALKDVLDDAVSAGKDLKDAGSSDDAANTAAATAINEAIAALKASMDTYAKFLAFIEGPLTAAVDKYDGSDLSQLSDDLADDRDEYTSKYEEGGYTTAEIEEIMNGFNGRIVAAVTEAMAVAATDGKEHNLDISCLFTNLDFANSTVTGWQNETGTSAFLSRVQTAEVWNQANFNVYQTLTNMPAGAYELQANGFYRSADNATNYAQYESNEVAAKAYIYAGGNKKLMHNVAEYAVSEQDDYHEAAAVEGSLYVPNSNASAHYVFYDQNEGSNSVVTALVEDGDLTIGVKGENLESNAWVVWGACTVIYKGTVGMNNALYEQVMAMVEEAQDLSDAAALVTEAENKINDALNAADACSETSSIETLTAAIKALDEAMAYTKESSKKVNELNSLIVIYNEYLMGEVESSEETFGDWLADAQTKCEEGGFKSNEDVQAYIDELPARFTKFVQYDALSTATLDEPADISKAILNAGFEGIASESGNAQYWSYTMDGGSAGYANGIYENYNSTSFDIHQTVKGLEPGYYRVRVQSFYRSGGNQANADSVAVDSANVVTFYANTVEKVVNNQLENGTNGELYGVGDEPAITVGENTSYYVPNNREALAAQFDADLYWNELDVQVGEDGVLTIGLKKEKHVDMDWCPFDNFRLLYLGKTAPTGIEGVEIENVLVSNGKIYDLSGRQVSKAQRGVYVINGRKVVK